jgi:hypothetical protein
MVGIASLDECCPIDSGAERLGGQEQQQHCGDGGPKHGAAARAARVRVGSISGLICHPAAMLELRAPSIKAWV